MGMYDVVYLPCPACGGRCYEQTKGGDCKLEDYEFEQATPAMIGWLLLADEVFKCECGADFVLKAKFWTELVREGDE